MNYEIDIETLPDKKGYDLSGVPDIGRPPGYYPDTSAPSVYQRALRFFSNDDMQKKSTEATIALVDSERLGISPSAAYRHRYAIDKQIKANPEQFSLQSNMLDRVKQSVEIGKKQNQIGELGYKYIMSGNEADLKSMLAVQMPSPEESFLPEGRLEEHLRQAAQMVPMMVDSAVEAGWKGATIGSLMALGVTLMGQPELSPGMAALGFKIGGAEGIFESAMRKEAGLALYEIMNIQDDDGNKIDPVIARGAAFGIGVVNGVIEVAQFKTLLKSIPGADKLFSDAIEKTLTSKTVRQQLLNIAKTYAKTVGIETSQEVAQESTNIVFTTLAIELNNSIKGTDIDQASINDVFQRLKDTAIQSAKGFSVIAAPGPVMSIAGTRTVNYQETQVAREKVAQTEGQFQSITVDEQGIAESVNIIDPETDNELSFDIETTPEEIDRTIQENRTETQIDDSFFDDLIQGEAEITEDNLESILDKIQVTETLKIEEPITIDLNNREQVAPIIETLNQNIETPENAQTEIETLGSAVFQDGIVEQQPFMNRMRMILGDLWEAFKGVVAQIWEKLKEERGSIEFTDKNIKTRIRKATGQVKQDTQVSERQALKGGLQKEQRISKQIYKEGKRVGKEEALKPRTETLKGRIARTTGIKKISNMIREDQALKTSFTKAAQAARKAYRAGDMEGVAREKARMKEIIERARQRETKKKLISEIGNISKKAVRSNIAVDYKKKITELLKGFDLKTLTEKKRKRLESLAQYVNENGVPLGINKKRISELDRLSKKPLSELSIDELNSLKNSIKMLKALGKLKSKLSRFVDQREKEKKINRLISSTKNLDKQRQKKKELTRIEKTNQVMYDSLKDYYIETLHTPRVADMMDGFKNYQGPNARMIKQQVHAEQNANERTTDRINRLLDKLDEADLLMGLTEEQEIRMMIHIRYQEGAHNAVQSLLDFYGFEIPEGEIINDKNPLSNYVAISPQEQQIIDIIRDVINERRFDIAALHEELTNDVFEFVDNYTLPLVYEKSQVENPSDIVREDFNDTDETGNTVFRTKKTFQGFTIKRKPSVKRIPRVDIFNIFETAISAQEWYLNMQPVLIEHAGLVFDKTFQENVGDTVSNWWKDQIDIVARRGWKAGYRSNSLSRGLNAVRQNMNRGVLLYKLSTILMQPFAVIDAMAFTMNKYGASAAIEVGKEFTKSILNWRYAQKIIDSSPALQQRKGGELAMEEVLRDASKKDAIFNKAEKIGYNLIQKTDILTAAGVRQGILNTLLDQGLSEKEANAEADFVMNMTQGSANVTLRPHIIGSGEGFRTLFTFQTFFLNRWGIMVHDLIGSGVKGDYKAKLYSLLGLSVFILGGLSEDEARRQIYNLLKRNDTKSDINLLEEVIYSVPEQIPLAGNIIKKTRRGYGSMTPVVGVAEKGVKGGMNIFKGNIGKGTQQLSEAVMILYLGVPGTSQAFDIFEYMTEQEQGR